MNSCQRVLKTIRHEEPDCVPVGEQLIDEAVRSKLYGDISYIDFLDRIDTDIVFAYRGRRFEKIENGLLKDEWNVIFHPSAEKNPYPIEGPIKGEEDLNHYVAPDPTAEYMFAELVEVAKRFKGKRAIGFMMLDVFSIPTFLRGMDTLLMDLIEHPSLVHGLAELVMEYDLKLIEGAIKHGAEIIQCGCDYAHNGGPFMSPAHFREFFLPGLKKLVERTHELGGYFLKHCDGNIWPLLDMFLEADIDILNPIEPVAGMDIGEVKQKYGDRVCLMGNIDCGDLLTNGTVAEVKAAVREVILKAAKGGGLIISSSNSIHSQVKPENFLAMIEATREYGRYA